jgi:predicted DNA-binding protein (UPF0251 family)
MNLQEFKDAMGIKEATYIKGSELDPYPYRVGSTERIHATSDTVDLVFILKAQGMNQRQIAQEMWMDQATLSRLINRHKDRL